MSEYISLHGSMKCKLLTLSGLLLASQAMADIQTMSELLKQQPTQGYFEICWGGGCAHRVPTELTDQEWDIVNQSFFPWPNSAEEEREAISMALGAMESVVGPKTGTVLDKAGTFGNAQYPGQLDCNDESTNTTTYLKLFKLANLLQFHHVMDTKTRRFFYNGWPHTTAVIQEIATGVSFAVDSWFHDNGEPAEIIPLSVWLEGWRPETSSAE